MCHEAVDEGGVDHEGDEEAYPLEDPAGDDDVQGADAGDVGREDAGVWAYYQQGVGGEDPDGRHLGDCEGLGGPAGPVVSFWGRVVVEGESLQDEVDAAAKDNCQDAIDPEEDEHGVEEPCAGLADRRTVLCDVD